MFKNLWVLINCKINKILSLLAIMIFVLGLSFSNADIYRTWTEEDLKNVILNMYQMKTSMDIEKGKIALENYGTQITTITNLLNSCDYNYIMMRTSTGPIDIAIWNTSNLGNTHPFWSTNRISFKNRPPTEHLYMLTYTNGTTWNIRTSSNLNDPSSWAHFTGLGYYGTPVYTGANVNTIKFNGGSYEPSNLFAENWYSNTKWELVPNSNNTITIPNMPYNYYTLNKGTFTTSFATLSDSSYTNNILMSIYAYNGSEWENVKSLYLFDEAKEIISDKFPSTTTGDIMSSLIQVNSNIFAANCIISLTASPNPGIAQDLGLTEVGQYFYITNSKTVITANSLDIIATFSGDTDYSNEVNQAIENAQNNDNSNNLQEIVSSINDNSQVDSIVDEYFGTSGDLLTKLGYTSYGNPLVDTFYNILITIKNLLLSNDDITYDIYIYNNYWGTLSSADFTTSGPIRIFVQALCIFLIVRFILKLFYSNFQNIVEGDIAPIVNFFKGKSSLITKFF